MSDKNNGEHLFLWQIENFSACTHSKRQYLCSPAFRARDLDDTSWNILLGPRGDEDERMISVHLLRSLDDEGPTDLHLELEVCLIDLNGEERFNKSASFTLKHSTSFSSFFYRGDVFEGRDTLLPNDVLTLLIRARKSVEHCRFYATRSVVRTKIRVERSSFLWTIRGFARKTLLNRRVVLIESDVACMELECGYAVTLHESPGNQRALRFAIKPRDVTKVQIYMSVKIQALDGHIDPPAKIESEHIFDAGSMDTWRLPCFDASNRLEGLLEGGQLDLDCQISISDGSGDRQIEGTSIPLADKFYLEENTLTQAVGSAYKSDISVTPDILLEVCDGSNFFDAHKFILSIRSRVFREALNRFDADKKRRKANDANAPATTNNAVCVRHKHFTISEVDGVDCARILHTSPHVLAQMLKCMYTDTLYPDSVGNAMYLHSAGVRFDFTLLREKSEMYLKSKIAVKSLFPILIFAHLNRVERLKCDCLNFMSKNRELAFLIPDEWDNLCEGHEDLAQEISNILIS